MVELSLQGTHGCGLSGLANRPDLCVVTAQVGSADLYTTGIRKDLQKGIVTNVQMRT